jgi:hypothetical protein
MNLEIQTLWSPGLNPPSGGLPPDHTDFDVFVQVSIGEAGKDGGEVFGCRVCSARKLAATPTGQFVHALILASFDWVELRDRIASLLLHARSCGNWDAAIRKLAPYIHISVEAALVEVGDQRGEPLIE